MAEARIERIAGRRVWDSRGRPTVEAEIFLDNGASGRAIAPAGPSTGTPEAVELRDGGAAFGGFGVAQPIPNANGETRPPPPSTPTPHPNPAPRDTTRLRAPPTQR